MEDHFRTAPAKTFLKATEYIFSGNACTLIQWVCKTPLAEFSIEERKPLLIYLIPLTT